MYKGNGECVCENHGYTEVQCLEKGCCKFDHSIGKVPSILKQKVFGKPLFEPCQCIFDVGTAAPCMKINTNTSCNGNMHYSGNHVIHYYYKTL